MIGSSRTTDVESTVTTVSNQLISYHCMYRIIVAKKCMVLNVMYCSTLSCSHDMFEAVRGCSCHCHGNENPHIHISVTEVYMQSSQDTRQHTNVWTYLFTPVPSDAPGKEQRVIVPLPCQQVFFTFQINCFLAQS